MKKMVFLFILFLCPVMSHSMARGPQGDKGEKGDRGEPGDPCEDVLIETYQGFLTPSMTFTIEPNWSISNIRAYQVIPSSNPMNFYQWIILPSSPSDVSSPYATINKNLVSFWNMKIGDSFGVSWFKKFRYFKE